MNEEDRKKWLKERMNGIGASDAPAILGVSPYMTPLGIYLTKTGEWTPEDNPEKKSGRMLEDVVAQLYEEATGLMVLPPNEAIVWHKEHPWMFCSPDRRAFYKENEAQEVCLVEIKTSRFAEGYGEEGTEEIPEMVMAQVQHQLACTGMERVDVALLIGGQELRIYPIKRDQNFISGMIPVLHDFWQKVQARTPPEFDWSHPATAKLIRQMHQKVTEGKTQYLDTKELQLLITQHEAVSEQIRDMKNFKEWVTAKLMEIVGDTALTMTPFGRSIRKKNITRKGYHVEPSSYTQIVIIDERKSHDAISRAEHHQSQALLGNGSGSGADLQGAALDDES